MKLKPFSKRCGILVEDVQLSDLDSQQFDELRQAFALDWRMRRMHARIESDI